jgi:hypothetical protein
MEEMETDRAHAERLSKRLIDGRGVHSSMFQLNLSRHCHSQD